MSLRLYALTFALVATTIFADYFLKLASQRGNGWATSAPFVVGAAIYAVSAVGWVLAMREMSLAGIAVIYSALTLVMLAGLGVVVFRETLSWREIVGLALALGALGLMHKPD